MPIRLLSILVLSLPLAVACADGPTASLSDFLPPDEADNGFDDTADPASPDDGRPDDAEAPEDATDTSAEAVADTAAEAATDTEPEAGDTSAPDTSETDAEATDVTPPQDPGTDVSDPATPDAQEPFGTCANPIAVWAGKAIGPELPPASLNYDARTGRVTAITHPSCGPAGSQGEVAFRLTIGSPTYAIVNVESQLGEFSPVISYVKESCGGSEVDCTLSDNAGRMAELATALPPGTYIAIVRLFPQIQGLDPIGVEVGVSFDFEAGEICNNDTDDNTDGDTDCDDPTCFSDPFCSGGHSGEDCTDPYLVNGGNPQPSGVEFFASGTLGGRIDDYQATASCWAGSAGSGDAVWRVVLGVPMTLEIAVGFYDGTFGHAYVLDATCTSLAACVPATFSGDPNVLVTLPAGTWNIVVDRGAIPPTDLNFDLAIFFDEP